jgi:hypothetical protein
MCAFMFGLCYIHVNKYRGEKMIRNKFNGDGSCQGRSASDWSDPHQAPPTDPLKYGTPERYNFMGDEEWNAI